MARARSGLVAHGRWIAYSSDEAGSFDIWLTTPSGQISGHLTSMSGVEDTPSWTSDGETLMF
jgi:Tol biopolymer transport system component